MTLQKTKQKPNKISILFSFYLKNFFKKGIKVIWKIVFGIYSLLMCIITFALYDPFYINKWKADFDEPQGFWSDYLIPEGMKLLALLGLALIWAGAISCAIVIPLV